MKSTFPLAAAGLVLAASVAFAQPPAATPPQPPSKQGMQMLGGQNLQVLGPSFPRRALNNMMGEFTAALGVNCSYCHVPGNFAADDNPKKNIARGMMRMLLQLNNQTLPAIAGIGPTRVSCATCHRGAAVPSLTPRPTPPGALPKQ